MTRWQWIVCASVLAVGCGDGGTTTTDGGLPPRADASMGGATLLVVVAGTGSGRVTSAPVGIDCGADCGEGFAPGTLVTLTAMPAAGSTFDGWSGACTGTGTCAVTIGAPLAVSATFTLEELALSIVPAGTGGGDVTSEPLGIDCGADCTESYPYGTMVELTASPALDSTFVGWAGGGCSGTGPCTTTITDAVTITPTFDVLRFALTVTPDGTGLGTVISDVAGIDCGSDCSELYDFGTVVTLTATAGARSAFTGWSGPCAGTDPCVVALEAVVAVGATFTLTPYAGTIALVEEAVLNPGTSGTLSGQGVRVSITFEDGSVAPTPVLEETPGSFFGCRAWSYTAAEAREASVGVDEGPIQIDSPAGSGTALFPVCTYSAGVGYVCPHLGTASTGGNISLGPIAGSGALTDVDVTFNAGNTTNRYVVITGATVPRNNGTFPILALGGANTILYQNPGVVAEMLPATAFHVNYAGVGATPTAPDPGFLADTAALDFRHTLGGGGHFPDFTATTDAGGVGDDFTLALTELNRLTAIPRDGSSFTVSCGATCGTGGMTMLDLVTTDAPTAGLSPFAMPPAITRSVRVRCAVATPADVTVPAAYSALLMGSGATRIRASFLRATLMTGAGADVTAYAGHAITGFSN